MNYGRKATVAALTLGVALGSTIIGSEARAATDELKPPADLAARASCSTWKGASWGEGWACYTRNAAGQRIRVHGKIKDKVTDGYCISFAMYSHNSETAQIGGWFARHHNYACTTGAVKEFDFPITISGYSPDTTPGTYWDARARITKENSAGTVINYYTID